MKGSKLFYGYTIVASGFSIQAIGVGTFVAFGIFFKPLLTDFDWSRATISGAQSMVMVVAGLSAMFLGRLNDKFSPRILMTAGGLCCGLGVLLMSVLSNVWQLYLYYGMLFGIGYSAIDIIPLTTVARWFIRRRGMMTGILKVGTGAGQLVIPILASVLIAIYGWRTSYIIIGAIVMFLLIIIGQLLRRDPASKGLLPDGDRMTQTVSLKPIENGSHPHEALRTRQFWTIGMAYIFTMYTLLTIMLHIVPHATDIRISGTLAASVLSVIGGISMAGRFVIGATIDRIGSKSSMVICLVLLISALLWLQLASELWMLYLFAIVYGFSHGGLCTVISPIVAEYFGLRSHGALFGIIYFISMVGGATGPVIAGYIFDITTSYNLAFWICTASSAIALGLILSLRTISKDKEITRESL